MRLWRELSAWMEGLGVWVPPTVDLRQPVVDEFRDGVLLAQLLSVLELSKIRGIDPSPFAQAAALRNIRKSLTVLQKKASVPVQYLHAEREIYKGNPRVLLGLLLAVKKAYPHRTPVRPKSPRSQIHHGYPTFGSPRAAGSTTLKSRKTSFQFTPPRDELRGGTSGRARHSQSPPIGEPFSLGPYGTVAHRGAAGGYDSSERKYYTLRPEERVVFLQQPGHAWD